MLATAANLKTWLDRVKDVSGLPGGTMPLYIGGALKLALGLAGMAFLIMIVYGGYLWMTAMGEETKIENAKRTIVAAAIGLVLILGSYTFVSYIVGELVKTMK